MNLSPESFYRWKHDPLTIAVMEFIQTALAEINEELANGYGLLDLSSEEMAKKLAKLIGRKEAYLNLLDLELGDLEGDSEHGLLEIQPDRASSID